MVRPTKYHNEAQKKAARAEKRLPELNKATRAEKKLQELKKLPGLKKSCHSSELAILVILSDD